MPTETELNHARHILRLDYQEDIDNIISDAKWEKEQGNLADEEAIREWLEQTVDGHQRIIYTGQNFETLLCCSNHDAYTEQMGSDGVISGDSVNWAALAFMALLEDVMEAANDADLFDFPADADEVGYDETKDEEDEPWFICPKCGSQDTEYRRVNHVGLVVCQNCDHEFSEEE